MGLRFIGTEDTDLEVKINNVIKSELIISLSQGDGDMNWIGYTSLDLDTAKSLHLIIGSKIEEIIQNNKIKEGENGK